MTVMSRLRQMRGIKTMVFGAAIVAAPYAFDLKIPQLKYTPQRVFQRLKEVADKPAIGRDPKKLKELLAQVRNDMKKCEDQKGTELPPNNTKMMADTAEGNGCTPEELCVFEKRTRSIMENGSPVPAEREEAAKWEPYGECKGKIGFDNTYISTVGQKFADGMMYFGIFIFAIGIVTAVISLFSKPKPGTP